MQKPSADPLLLLASVLFPALLLIDLGLLMFSPMMFDAPGSERSVYPWIIIATLINYPLTVLLGLRLAWAAHARGDVGMARRTLVLPITGVGLVVGSFVLLQVVCAGQFACD